LKAYRKGIKAERALVRRLKDKEYLTYRAAGSRGGADIIAGKKELLGLSKKKFAIQVKSTGKEVLKISRKKIAKLREDSAVFGITAVLAVRFPGEKWRFWSDNEEDLEESSLQGLLSEKGPPSN
jgi:Holliday junction resolvase